VSENELDQWLFNHQNEELYYKEDDFLEEKKNSAPKKKNEIPEIDLHGLTVPKAIARMSLFIQNQPNTVNKVRIIHGKGIHSEEKESVLRKEVWHWLKKEKNRKNRIKDFSYSKPSEGGEGATLVWLS